MELSLFVIIIIVSIIIIIIINQLVGLCGINFPRIVGLTLQNSTNIFSVDYILPFTLLPDREKVPTKNSTR